MHVIGFVETLLQEAVCELAAHHKVSALVG